MQTLKDFKERIVGPKYHHNLLGESLSDLLRKATAKTLVTPDEEINQQVVDIIRQEVAAGKDTKEIVSLLKKRLRTDNPQKQWLGVLLFSQVMQDCSNILAMHQEELLQEVARVMARPAKPETDAGKRARSAAKELLRNYGRAGTSAFRAAHQAAYAGLPGHPGTYPAPGIPVGHYGGAYGGGRGSGSVERQSLIEEVNLLIEKARSNTELLSDMLVNQGGAGRDEFEAELIADLSTEVVELRGVFNAYLEQLQAFEGADMEVLMVQALEAADMLDGCMQLQADVNDNQQLPQEGGAHPGATQAAPAPAPAPAAAAAAAGGAVGGAAAVGHAAAPAAAATAPAPAAAGGASVFDDLIALDDLAAGMGAASVNEGAAAADPFAASMAAPIMGAPAPQQAPPPMKSAFEAMYTQPGAGAYSSLAMGGLPTAAPAPAHNQGGYPPAAASQAAAGGSPWGAPQYPQQYPAPPQPQNQAGPTPGYGYPAPAPPAYSAPAPANPYAPAPNGMVSVGSGNPFAAAAMPLRAPAASSGGGSAVGSMLPMPPLVAGAGPGGGNPFAATAAHPPAAAAVLPPAAQSSGQSGVDKEWEMFFADRAVASQPPQAQPQGNVHADFDNVVGRA